MFCGLNVAVDEADLFLVVVRCGAVGERVEARGRIRTHEGQRQTSDLRSRASRHELAQVLAVDVLERGVGVSSWCKPHVVAPARWSRASASPGCALVHEARDEVGVLREVGQNFLDDA